MKGELAFVILISLFLAVFFDDSEKKRIHAIGFYLLAFIAAARLVWLLAFPGGEL